MIVIPNLDAQGLPDNGSVQTIGTMRNIMFACTHDENNFKFTLNIKINYRNFITEFYTMYPTSVLNVDLREMLRHSFDFRPPMFMLPYQLSSNIKDVTLEISQGLYYYSVQFFIVNNRLDISHSDTMFFTQQPRRKRVYNSDIEFLTVCAVDSPKTIYCRAYNRSEDQTVEYAVIIGGVQDIVVKFDELKRKFTLPNITSYYFFTEDYDEAANGQCYDLIPGRAPEVPIFYFENSAGGFDMIRPSGAIKDKSKIKTQTTQNSRETLSYHVEDSGIINVNSGHLATREERIFFMDFFNSRHKYIYENGELLEIVATEATADAVRRELCSFHFDYRYAISRPSLSPRYTAYPQANLGKRQFRLYPSISRPQGKSEFMQFYFREDVEQKTFPDQYFYDVAISGKLHNCLNPANPQFRNTNIKYPRSDMTITKPQSTVQGFVSVIDRMTGREAVALVVIPKTEMTGFLNPDIILRDGDSSFTLHFKSPYGKHYFDSWKDFTFEISSELHNYILPVGQGEDFIDFDTMNSVHKTITGTITLTDLINNRSFKAKITRS